MESPDCSNTPALYIRRPVESLDLFTNVQRAIRGVMGDSPAFLPRRQAIASVSLLRESEMHNALNRSPSLRAHDVEAIRAHIMDSLPETHSQLIRVEPEDIVTVRGLRRHLAVTLHSPEVANEREAVIGAMADLGDTPTPWIRGAGHISFGFFTRPVTPKTMMRIEEAVAQNLPNTFVLGEVGDDPAIRAYMPSSANIQEKRPC